MSRQNYYLLLELDPNVDDFATIKKQISQKRNEWSRLRNRPDGDKALAKLEALEGIEQVMDDAEGRRTESESAKWILKEEQAEVERTKYIDLDASIAIIGQKGWIEKAEIDLMVKQFSLTQNQIENRVVLPIENNPIQHKKKKREKVDTSRAEKIAAGCEKLGIKTNHISGVPSLYDYLDLAPTSLNDTLIERANEKYRQIAMNKKSALNNVDLDTHSHCKSILNNGKDTYDKALSQLRLQKLKTYLTVASATEKIHAPVVDQLKKKAMELGDLDEDEAQTYIEDFCSEHKIELIDENPDIASHTFKKCGFCGLINDEADTYCKNCQTNLDVTCPSCKKQSQSSDQACAHCGFLLGNMANVPHTLGQAKVSIRLERFEEAKQLLVKILDWWPNHSVAEKMLNTIKANEQKEQAKRTRIKEIIAKRHYYTARELFIEDPKHVQSSLSLQNMEKECLQQIHLAESYMRQAENSSDRETKAGYYWKALEVAADCSKAKQMLNRMPPSPPSALKVSSDSTRILIKWNPSSSQGEVTYRLLRKKGNVSQDEKDGEIMQESSRCTFTDHTAVAGIAYYYSVYTIREKNPANANISQGPIIRKAEVDQIGIFQEGNSIELKWTKPVSAHAIEVWKKENGVPKNRHDGILVEGISDTGVTDPDVVYGQSYGYRIIVYYQAAGKTVHSEGLTRQLKVTHLPEALIDLTVIRQEDGIELNWEEIKVPFAIYYSQTPFNMHQGEQMPVEDFPNALPQTAQKLEVTLNQNNGFISIDTKRPVYILSVTNNEEIALIGKTILLKDHPEVRNIRHDVTTDELVLKWEWPSEATNAIIRIDESAYPESPDDANTKQITLTKKEYDATNGYQLVSEERDYYITIFTEYEDAGKLVLSNGVNYFLMNSKQANLKYSLKVSNSFFSQKIRLNITSDRSLTLPSLTLVKRNKSMPTNKEQGEVILQIETQRMDGKIEFDISFEHMQKDSYARLFFEDEEDGKRIRLQMESGKESIQLW